MNKPDRAAIDRLTKELVDKGKLIEAGWIALRMLSVPAGASKAQLDDMRSAFFAGAQHLLGSLMSVLEPDAEPTDADLNRMALIHKELDEFIRSYKKQHGF